MYNLRQRKKLRLNNYDYSRNGFYFITICTKNRQNYFGEIINGKLILNDYGKIAECVFLNLPNHYKNCIIDEYIFMPNHFHGIIVIDNLMDVRNIMDVGTVMDVGTGLKPVPTENTENTKIHGLSEMVRGFKTFSSRNINKIQNDFTFSWQRSFYDIIIKNKNQLEKTRQYIINNPLKWEQDINNLKNKKYQKALTKY